MPASLVSAFLRNCRQQASSVLCNPDVKLSLFDAAMQTVLSRELHR